MEDQVNTRKSGFKLKTLIVIALVAAVAALIYDRERTAREIPAKQLPTQTQADKVDGKQLPRLLDLGAGICIPCKMMTPILEDLKKTYAGKLDVQFIDIRETPDAVKKFGIGIIPTQIFYDAAGKELFRHEGFFSKEDIIVKWKELGMDFGEAENPAKINKERT